MKGALSTVLIVSSITLLPLPHKLCTGPSCPPEVVPSHPHPSHVISGPDEIVELVARTMPSSTKLAVFDAVTSNTALVLPIERLVELCKSR